ncbi:MAG: hypothetical protein EWV77_18200 [Microcystis viridis Mv_BB_P_19951000_S68D]|uniref:Uncharacterized protein n=1 Tax=Microcystis viridis Mv_BB_P_19951000_S68D TaxID=2486270 RepID=A0A552HF23_MICVR|nr:MAG: hypothetical protein EWV77_18200 [Microcystis viridis Mv_BB_P_19951000_S68D]
MIIAIFSTPKPPTKPSRKAAVKSVISYQLSVISYQLSVGKLSDLSFKWGLLKNPRSAEGAGSRRPDSNGFCPQCRGELRSPKRYMIKAQVPYQKPRLPLGITVNQLVFAKAICS